MVVKVFLVNFKSSIQVVKIGTQVRLKYRTQTLVYTSYVLKCGSDCKGVVMAAWRSFNVQVGEGESDLVALGHTEVPLPLQVGRVRPGILRRLHLPMHERLRVWQPPALAH